MNSPQALAEYARSTTSGCAPARRWGRAGPTRRLLERDATHVAMVDICWTGGLTEARKIASLAEAYHRPFAPHDCTGPVGYAAGGARLFQPAEHAHPGVGPRLLLRLVSGSGHGQVPVIRDGYVLPMEGPGLGTELLPGRVRAVRPRPSDAQAPLSPEMPMSHRAFRPDRPDGPRDRLLARTGAGHGGGAGRRGRRRRAERRRPGPARRGGGRDARPGPGGARGLLRRDRRGRGPSPRSSGWTGRGSRSTSW